MQNKRLQDNWKIRPNNANLMVNPSQNDVQNVYSFCQQFNIHLNNFVYTSIAVPKCIKMEQPPLIVNNQQTFMMIMEILKEQRFVFIDVINQTKSSYKGYISWMIIATHNQLYVIDAGNLHDKCYDLKGILESHNIVKFMHDCEEVLFALKRDFEIFMPNLFDLEVIQRYLVNKGKINTQPKQLFKDFIRSSSSSVITSRPIKQSLLQKIKEFYENQMTLMLQMDKFFANQDPQFQCYAYFNHYEILLKSYLHHVPTVQEMDELHKIQHRLTYDKFIKYNQHRKINLQAQILKKDQFWIKNSQQELIANMLCEWRQHTAKMRDISSQQILSYKIVSKLAKTKINSILQISKICSQQSPVGIYPLSLDDFEQIFELIQLYEEQKDQKTHQLIIPRRIPYYKSGEQRPIKQLFQELKFTDVNNDWLNKKTDEAVKLYKQIVSINEFDNSIVDEYIKQITQSQNSPIHLNIEDINRYVKYAEYLRNGNHKKLQQLYEKTKGKSLSQKDQNEQYFEQNFIQEEEYNNWDEIQNELNIPTMDSIDPIKTSTSIMPFRDIKNIDVQSCQNLVTIKSTSLLKEKKLISLRQIQNPSQFFNKIDPLPESIEAIYLQAAKAKKNYTSKGQKKSNKPNKKQTKKASQTDSKKEDQFIPKKEHLFNLIYY